ncbi:MAG: SsrA-binding protein SmpB [Clostridia bacterium]|nr:SsrA-binding protein SmpB [Clostridia bacterium]
MKIITDNKQAKFEYFVIETYTAGIVLEGAEVKSLRAGNVNLKDSFCSLYKGEIFIKNMHVALYDKMGAFNSSNSKRDRKLLLRRAEINKIAGKINEKGLTIIPLNLFFEGSLVKVTVGICKGKHTYDKKDTIKERDIKRAQEREIKEYK